MLCVSENNILDLIFAYSLCLYTLEEQWFLLLAISQILQMEGLVYDNEFN